ncbi:unnamed protein product [Protopolystoma xenopodis]|uniref:Dynein heavy chain coiled coil stalk domain-containing protein n=1 Tax=Protopolystoma xenopodis TaxID=117903 RepID=A0A3S5BPT7_9PLAT|nr:unnamed protein product [Protopolystoma xenopodis]
MQTSDCFIHFVSHLFIHSLISTLSLSPNFIADLLTKRKITYEDVLSASKAGGGFFRFILSVVGFCDVAKEVRPKRERVRTLEREYLRAKRELQRLTDELTQLEEMLRTLKRQFAAAQMEMERLAAEMTVMQRQLLAAQKLTAGLSSEKERQEKCLHY